MSRFSFRYVIDKTDVEKALERLESMNGTILNISIVWNNLGYCIWTQHEDRSNDG